MPRSPLSEFSPDVRRTLPWLIVFRLISNAAMRYTFSFLPALARGSGLTIEQLGQVLSLRDLAGVGAPLLGRLSDRYSSRRLMVVMAVMSAVGLITATLGTAGFVISLMVIGIGKLGYDVSMNAWVAESVAYERRGKATGLVELSWAGSALLALPILGLLIDQVGWWSASLALGLIAAPVAGVIARQANDPEVKQVGTITTRRPHLTTSVVLTLAALALMSISSQLLIVGHGLWLEDTYGFGATGVGLAVLGIGTVEAISSVASSRFTDRFGKRNSVVAGMAVLCIALAALTLRPDPRLALGLLFLAIAFLGFEFALVSALPLIGELDPGARAQTVGLALGFSTAMRAGSSLVGVMLYLNRGPSQLFAAGLVAGLATIAVLILGVSEPQPSMENQPA